VLESGARGRCGALWSSKASLFTFVDGFSGSSNAFSTPGDGSFGILSQVESSKTDFLRSSEAVSRSSKGPSGSGGGSKGRGRLLGWAWRCS
jgi:hypothetical protein